MSSLTDRLSEDDFRELARLIRRIHARTEAEQRDREQKESRASEGDSRREPGEKVGPDGCGHPAPPDGPRLTATSSDRADRKGRGHDGS